MEECYYNDSSVCSSNKTKDNDESNNFPHKTNILEMALKWHF